jgi:hypothetical protein
MAEIVHEKQATKKRRNLPPSQITTFKKAMNLILNHPTQQDLLEDSMLFITKEYGQGHNKPQEQRLKEKVEIQLPNK